MSKRFVELVQYIGIAAILPLMVLMYIEHQTRLKLEHDHNDLRISSSQLREVYQIDSITMGLRGQNLRVLLDVPKTFYDNIIQEHSLQKPYCVLVVKEIDCTSCYNQETGSIQILLQQHIPVMVLAFQEADFIDRDFKQRIILFPPPFTQTLLHNLSAKMALLWVSPEGLILDAEIPSINFPDRSKKFYERIRTYNSLVKIEN